MQTRVVCLESQMAAIGQPPLPPEPTLPFIHQMTAELLFFDSWVRSWQESEAPKIEKLFWLIKKKAIQVFKRNFDVS